MRSATHLAAWFAIVLLFCLGDAVPAQDIKSLVKLPGAVTKRLSEIDSVLKKADQTLAKNITALKSDTLKNAELQINQASEVYDSIFKDYGTKVTPAHPEMLARKTHIDASRKKFAEVTEKWQAQQQSTATAAGDAKAIDEQWLAKLRMYVAGPGNPDYDAAHSLVVAPSQDPAEVERQRKLYDEASAILEEFKKQAFPNGKSDQLEQAARDFEFRLKGLQQNIGAASSVANEQVESRLVAAESLLSASEGNKDPAYVPNYVAKRDVDELKQMVAQAIAVSSEEGQKQQLQKRLDEILKRNEAIVALRKSRIQMKPTKFSGPELADVQTRANALVLEKFADAKVLATTVISPDWKEEDVVESTDTTNTAIRRRITRSVTAQVAAKLGEEVTLYTVDVSKDKRSDGSWGVLYGNIMYTDAMLEANVPK